MISALLFQQLAFYVISEAQEKYLKYKLQMYRCTCGYTVTLAKKQCILDIIKFSFSQRIVNEWNTLSADCVGASRVNLSKIKATYT